MHLAPMLGACKFMEISKPIFFVALAVLIAGPFWTVRAIWVMRSVKTQGVFGFAGNGFAGDQVKQDYSDISFEVGKKEVWFNGLGNLGYKPGQRISIRYRPDDPYDARVDIFAAIWGDILVYSGIPVFLLAVLFLHPQVVPWGSRLRLTSTPPFIQILSSKPITDG